jgi:AraC family transcriptional regulator, positive regulator of tynA and feaB
MQTILDTAGLPPAEAFDFWMDVACDRLSASRAMAPHDRRSFSAEFSADALADLPVVHWRMAPIDSRSSSRDGLILLFPRSGRASLRFGDAECELNSGAVYLIDYQTAHRAQFPEPTEFMGVQIPRDVLARRLNCSVAKVVNLPVPAQGDAALLVAVTRDIVRIGPSTLSLAAAAAEREHLLDLAALAFAPFTGKPPRLGASARMIALKLKTAVEAQLGNPEADRGSICAAAGVSERNANRVLAQEGTSVMHLLHQRRLEKCRLALEKTDRPVAEIAYSWGYAEVSHFARVFRARYGATPREHRFSAR